MNTYRSWRTLCNSVLYFYSMGSGDRTQVTWPNNIILPAKPSHRSKIWLFLS